MEDNWDRLRGRNLSQSEISRLKERLPCRLPAKLADLLANALIVGECLSVSEENDLSRLGAELQWMSPEQMISEATETYPGIVAIARGYVPIAMCLEGSGDPYFWRETDDAIVRIPHDAAAEDSLDEERIELVAQSVEQLLAVSNLS
jgi:hypothetical protein